MKKHHLIVQLAIVASLASTLAGCDGYIVDDSPAIPHYGPPVIVPVDRHRHHYRPVPVPVPTPSGPRYRPSHHGQPHYGPPVPTPSQPHYGPPVPTPSQPHYGPPNAGHAHYGPPA